MVASRSPFSTSAVLKPTVSRGPAKLYQAPQPAPPTAARSTTTIRTVFMMRCMGVPLMRTYTLSQLLAVTAQVAQQTVQLAAFFRRENADEPLLLRLMAGQNPFHQ